MAITSKGRWSSSALTEKGRFVIGSVIEQGNDILLVSKANNHPSVEIISVDRKKISNISGIDRAVVVFKFDIDITSWEVRVMGTGQGTGTLAGYGGAVSSGANISAEVDFSELYQEGDNRINIYGKSASGTWTPYES